MYCSNKQRHEVTPTLADQHATKLVIRRAKVGETIDNIRLVLKRQTEGGGWIELAKSRRWDSLLRVVELPGSCSSKVDDFNQNTQRNVDIHSLIKTNMKRMKHKLF